MGLSEYVATYPPAPYTLTHSGLTVVFQRHFIGDVGPHENGAGDTQQVPDDVGYEQNASTLCHIKALRNTEKWKEQTVVQPTLTLAKPTSQCCTHRVSRQCHVSVPKSGDCFVRTDNEKSTTLNRWQLEPFHLILLKKTAKRIDSEIWKLQAFKDGDCTFGTRVRKTAGARSCCIPELLALTFLSKYLQKYKSHYLLLSLFQAVFPSIVHISKTSFNLSATLFSIPTVLFSSTPFGTKSYMYIRSSPLNTTVYVTP